MYLGINLGVTTFGKSLKDGSSAVLTDSLHLRSIAEERVTRIKSMGGYKRSLAQLIKEENINIKEIVNATVTSCCDTINQEHPQVQDCSLSLQPLYVSHHYSHALSAFALSGFEKAIVAVWDCGGNIDERTSSVLNIQHWWEYHREQHTYYLVDRTGITIIDRDFYEPFEMGFGEVYRSLTHLLGFNSYIHSSKAMALAAYGKSSRFSKAELFSFRSGRIISDLKYIKKDNYSILVEWAKSHFGIILQKVRTGEKPSQELMDFAAFIQNSMETAAIKKINYLINKYQVKNICISGGVGLNCVMNSKIRRNTNLDQLFIPPASGDTGQSVGNAIFGYFETHKVIPDLSNFDIYMGSDLHVDDKLAKEFRLYHCLHIQDEAEKVNLAADLLLDGKIIGWCQGRSEWGPRALGNRSILCRTDLEETAKQLREEIKERNWFEPFAASVLREDVNEYFDVDLDQPYMLEVGRVNEEKRTVLQNCIHIDGSCRIQTVSKNDNPLFYSLLKEFKEKTGEGVLLNTSLNQRGQPICESERDAFKFFSASKLDIIFIDNYLIIKDQGIFENLLGKFNASKELEIELH